jgi:ferritin
MKQKILSTQIEEKLNGLIGQELYAMYAYKAMANWCQNAGFLSSYKFFLEESSDEKSHAEILEQYILDMGCVPKLEKIDKPDSSFKTLYDVIYEAYDMEVALGEKYSDMALICAKEDAITLTKIQEFIKIQTKSIGFYGDICAVAKGLSDNKFEQLMLEKILVKG